MVRIWSEIQGYGSEAAVVLFLRLKKLISDFDICCQAGNLEIFDVSSGDLLESVDAHSGAVWGLALTPDKVSV